MNIEKFIKKRKEMGYSQNDLAEGICTQATLSRFENNKKVPNLKILIKLCDRLELPLNELFPKVGVRYSETIEKLNQAEFYLITSEYSETIRLLDEIPAKDLKDPMIAMRFYYLKGFSMIFKEYPFTEIMFLFDQIVLGNQSDQSEIYRLLAYTGIGMLYARENDFEKAEFYFKKILEKIYKYPTENLEDMWRVLNIVFQCGVFYAEIEELEISNALLNYAITICADNHVTYYLARAALQLAENAMTQNKRKEEILELVYDARAYSKINRNKIALNRLKLIEEEINKK